MNDDTLTLYSIQCDERRSKYGHHYIVAANSEEEAEELILRDLRQVYDDVLRLALWEVRDEYGLKVYSCKPFKTTTHFEEPTIVSYEMLRTST